MSQHQPRCPHAMGTNGAPVRATADPQGQGGSPVYSGVVLLDDLEDLLSSGSGHRSLALRRLSVGGRLSGRQVSRRATSAALSRQTRENREYVRRLLKEKQPEFAAVIEAVKRELCREFHTGSWDVLGFYRTQEEDS